MSLKTFDEIKQEITPSEERKTQVYEAFLQAMIDISAFNMKAGEAKVIFKFTLSKSNDNVVLPAELEMNPDNDRVLNVNDIYQAVSRLRQLGFNFYSPGFTINNGIKSMNVVVDYSTKFGGISGQAGVTGYRVIQDNSATDLELFRLKCETEKGKIILSTVSAISLAFILGTIFVICKNRN